MADSLLLPEPLHVNDGHAGQRQAAAAVLSCQGNSRMQRTIMNGRRARLGFLIPPGNPTVEPELIAMTPPGVSIHFSRLVARGLAGSHHGQEERNRSQIEHIDESTSLLAMSPT